MSYRYTVRLASLLTALMLSGLAAAQPTAPTETLLGKEEVIASAEVIEVDPAGRLIVLQGPRGNVVALRADVSIPNLEQVRKGDVVTYERDAVAVISLEPLGTRASALAESVEQSARAAPGDKPGFAHIVTTTVTAQITQLDRRQRTLTFRGPRETLRTVAVKDPTIDLGAISAGQFVRIVYREMVSILVTGS
ncbi:hypothetical protein [Paracidovorax citrulli]